MAIIETEIYYTREVEAIRQKDFFVDRNDLQSMVKLLRAIDDDFYYDHTNMYAENPYTGEKRLTGRAIGIFGSPVFCLPCSNKFEWNIQCEMITALGAKKPNLIRCPKCETVYYSKGVGQKNPTT